MIIYFSQNKRDLKVRNKAVNNLIFKTGNSIPGPPLSKNWY